MREECVPDGGAKASPDERKSRGGCGLSALRERCGRSTVGLREGERRSTVGVREGERRVPSGVPSIDHRSGSDSDDEKKEDRSDRSDPGEDFYNLSNRSAEGDGDREAGACLTCRRVGRVFGGAWGDIVALGVGVWCAQQVCEKDVATRRDRGVLTQLVRLDARCLQAPPKKRALRHKNAKELAECLS